MKTDEEIIEEVYKEELGMWTMEMESAIMKARKSEREKRIEEEIEFLNIICNPNNSDYRAIKERILFLKELEKK